METVLTVLIVLLMFLAVVAGAAVPSAVWFLSKGKETRSTIAAFVIFFTLIIGVLGRLAYKPIVMYADGCESVMSEEQKRAVTSVSRGFYGHSAPVFAVAVSVNEVRDDYVAWDIFYFPFGDIGMEYVDRPTYGGYHITRYLVD